MFSNDVAVVNCQGLAIGYEDMKPRQVRAWMKVLGDPHFWIFGRAGPDGVKSSWLHSTIFLNSSMLRTRWILWPKREAQCAIFLCASEGLPFLDLHSM